MPFQNAFLYTFLIIYDQSWEFTPASVPTEIGLIERLCRETNEPVRGHWSMDPCRTACYCMQDRVQKTFFH